MSLAEPMPYSAFSTFRKSRTSSPQTSSATQSRPTPDWMISRGAPPPWLDYVGRRIREDLVGEPSGETPPLISSSVGIRAFSTAIRVLPYECPAPSVVPVDGVVQFVWHRSGWDISIEVGPEDEYVYVRERDGDESWDGDLTSPLNEHRLRRLLAAIGG
jgi:hypothetical protein